MTNVLFPDESKKETKTKEEALRELGSSQDFKYHKMSSNDVIK